MQIYAGHFSQTLKGLQPHSSTILFIVVLAEISQTKRL